MKNIILAAVIILALFAGSGLSQMIDWPLGKEQLARREAQRFTKAKEFNLQATQNQTNIDVVYYDINLEIIPETTSLSGWVGVTARVVNNSISILELNLLDNMQVDSVFVKNQSASFNHIDDLVTITLGRTFTPGEQLTVQIFYQGQPMSVDFGAFGFNTYATQPMIWSLSEPFGARNWWPCKDIPADKADSVDFRITVPDYLVAVSNGTLRSETVQDSKKTYWWHEQYPITTYLVSVAIHPYVKLSDSLEVVSGQMMPVEYYVFPSEVSNAQTAYEKTIDMIRIFSDLFGPYPFHEEKYGHAQFVGGANMEHQTISSLRTYSELTIAHELAHQWWGDMITCRDFGHIWLNEGFATYAQALWVEAYYGKDAYWDEMLRKKYFGPGTIFVTQMDVETIFHYGRSYQKGAWVLHMLRHVVGDEAFFQILKTYGSDPQYKFATAITEDFQQICEQVSGQDLQDFFRQWIYGEFYPVYAFKLTSRDSSGSFATQVTIQQKQMNTGLFHMPIDLLFDFDTGDTMVVVDNSLQQQTYYFVFNQKPEKVRLDPDDWILKGLIDISTTVPNPTAFELTSQYPNPFKLNCNFELELFKQASVSVDIFNILGQKIRTLHKGPLTVGEHHFTWKGDDDNRQAVPSGVYFFRITHPDLVKSVKILKVR